MDDFKEVKNFSGNKLAVVKNDAVEAIYENMNLNQLKLFIALVSLIEKGDTKFTQYQIDAKALATIFNMSEKDKDNIYLVSDRVTDGLIKRVMIVKNRENQEYEKYSIFSKISYKNGVLTISFNEQIMPFLLDLKENFTKFKLKEIKPFKSKYALRIYQLLKQYQSVGERTFDLDEFRTILDIKPNEFKKFGDFRRFVIEIAQKELEGTPIAFDWVITEKRGRKAAKIKLVLKTPKQKQDGVLLNEVKNLLNATKTQAIPQQLQQQPSSQIKTPEQTDERQLSNQPTKEIFILEDEEILKQFRALYSLIPQQYKSKVLDNLISRYIKEKGYLYVKQNVEYVLNQKNVKNFIVYLSKSLENDWGYAATSEIDAKLKQDEAKRFFLSVQELTFERRDILWTPVNCIYNPEKQEFVLECVGTDSEGKQKKLIFETPELKYLAKGLKWTGDIDTDNLLL